MSKKKRSGFELDQQSKREHTNGISWFFGIGINEYKEFPDLNNAVKDVKDIRSVLIDKYHLQEENSFLILDAEAIEENIIDRFDKLAYGVKEKDKLIIYYSGHGHLNKTTNLGYWIPHDAKKDHASRYIPNSTILDYIKVIKAKHILLISDSCFSGSLFARGGNRSTNTTLDELETFQSRWAICSGRHDEEVYDGQPGSNSPFAESIINTLTKNQREALNVSKLSDFIMEQTRANYSQLPEGSPLYGVGHKGGQFIFRLKSDNNAIEEIKREIASEHDVIPEPKVVTKKETGITPRTNEEKPSGQPGFFNKYWKYAAGAIVLVLAIWQLTALLGNTSKSIGPLDYTAYVVGDNIVVKGFVSDDFMALPGEENPQEGASVTLVGTDFITYTNAEGRYELSFPKDLKNNDLVFEHEGFQPLTVELVVSGELDSTPYLTVEEDDIYLGNIKAGDVVVHTISVSNTGTGQLEISNIKSSCECITADYPKTPIAPGESGNIRVRFDTKGKTGEQIKSLMIYSNSGNTEKKVTLTAYVN